MSSIETRIEDEQKRINQINADIRQLESQVSSSYLEPILTKQDQFQLINHHRHDNDLNDLDNLSITQLNNKSELINQKIQELERLGKVKKNLEEIEQLLASLKLSIGSLLDLQHLSTLFKQIQDAPSLASSSNYMIYKQIIRRVASLHVTFVDYLNNYLKLILPNEFTILHASVIGDFNNFVSKNGYNLSVYADYRTKWDGLIDQIFNGYEITVVNKEKEEEEIEDEFEIKEVKGTDFISSLVTFVNFINKINHTPVKNYLNSKISKLVAGQLFNHIEEIIHNQEQIKQLNVLMKLCEDTHWNFLSKIEGSGTIEERLNRLHLDWIIDDYVNKIRQVFSESSFAELKDVDEVVGQGETTTNNSTDDTDWDESWDDGWDEDDQEENQQAKDAQESKHVDSAPKLDRIKISPVPEQLDQLFKQFSTYSKDLNYLVTTIKALALVQYPSLASSFVMYNDFTKLSQTTGDASLVSFVNSNWNQVVTQFSQELKTLILSLNLESEIDMQDEILDDYNLNQLGLIYKWFQVLFEEKQFRQTNFKKFQQLVIELVDFANNWLLQLISTIEDISEQQCVLYSLLIDNLNNITVPFLGETGLTKDTIDSFSKLNNVKFLLNNHLKDIMDRFYQGELFDLTTDELVTIIKSIFIPSEIRDNYINEIIEFRNMS
ncbi:DSL1 [Candida margitis]|uniref:DSL1 n=1 Tax=Candida margitis TaxID=1775924 RepID=UPI0022273053|nr:DSL1 [Candida margitis]KAI5970662.1 DSL1 [Candida margitis]